MFSSFKILHLYMIVNAESLIHYTFSEPKELITNSTSEQYIKKERTTA
jgi:hypothetical protein